MAQPGEQRPTATARLVRRRPARRITRRTLGESGPYTRPALLQALRDPYTDPIPFLLDALRHGRIPVRLEAARMLEELPSPRSLPVLLASLSDDSSRLRYQAIDTLVAIGNRSIIDALLPLVDDPDEQVRANLAWALGQLSVHTPTVIAALCRLLQDTFWGTRRFAAETLFQIPDPIALPFLRAALPDLPAVRPWLWLALHRQGDPFPYADALRLLRSGDDLARAYTANALVIAASADPAMAPRIVRAFERLLATDRLTDELRTQLQEAHSRLLTLAGEADE